MPRPGPLRTGRRVALVALAAVTTTDLVPSVTASAEAAAKRTRPSVRLATFDRCADLLRYARRGALAHRELVPVAQPAPAARPGVPVPGAQPVPAQQEATTGDPQAGIDFSGTNVQEAGIDEPDVVKTDGRRIFAVAAGRLHALTVADDGTPVLRSSTALPPGLSHGSELLLHGDRLLVLGTWYGVTAAPAAQPRARSALSLAFPASSSAVLAELDVRDATAPKLVRSMVVDGRYVSARATGDTARVVITTPPQPVVLPADETPTQEEERARHRAAIAAAPLEVFRPRVAITRGGTTRLRGALPCSAIRHPRTFSGLDTTTVLTIDLDRGLPAVDADAVLGGGDTVYASPTGLVVASRRYDARLEQGGEPSFPTASTQLHRFAAGERATTGYRASGSVPGYLLNQFSLSEHRGVLRVATTEEPVTIGTAQTESSSTLSVLDERDGRLVRIGRVGGLGRGERIHAVRFTGDVAYVVTFRQTDPLYTIDLADPRAPRVLGELKILGYSAYLHPVGEDLLLGVGQDATETGRRLGTQLSLFDVSDLRAPRVLHRTRVGGSSFSSSEVEVDHRAFLWWAPRRTAVLPVSSFGDGDAFAGVIGYRADRASGIRELGRLEDPRDPAARDAYAPGIQRTLVVRGRLVTLSERGLGVASLDTLSRAGFVAFPADPDVAPPGPGVAEPQPAGTPTPGR